MLAITLMQICVTIIINSYFNVRSLPIIKLSSFIIDFHVNLKRLNEWSSFLCCSLRDGDGLLIFPLHVKSLLPASYSDIWPELQ